MNKVNNKTLTNNTYYCTLLVSGKLWLRTDIIRPNGCRNALIIEYQGLPN